MLQTYDDRRASNLNSPSVGAARRGKARFRITVKAYGWTLHS